MRTTDRKRIALEAILIFGAFFLTGFLSQNLSPSSRLENMTSIMLFTLVIAIPQILLILYILYLQNGRALADFGIVALSRKDPLRILLVYLGILAFILPVATVIQLLPDSARVTISQGYRWSLRDAAQLPLAFVFCIVSAYREELFFRSYLLTRLEQLGVAPELAVAATAILFSAGHFYEGWVGIAVTAIQGIYLAAVFLRLRNLHTISIAHGMYNFTIFCLGLLVGPVLPG
jgi:membrane protease YdiL (CAAX protease family)